MDDTIEVRITAQSSGLQSGLQQARDQVSSATQRMRDSFGKMRTESAHAMKEMSGEIGGEVEKMTGSFGKLLSVIPGVKAAFIALGAAFVAFEAVEKTAKMTEAAMDLGRALGVSTNEASNLQAALAGIHSSGGEYEAAAKGMSRAIRANEADMNKMGLATRDANGHLKPMTQLMTEGIEVVNGYKAGADRALASQTLFGRGISASSKLLLLNKEALAEGTAAADELGLTVGAKSVAAWQQFNSAEDRAELGVKGMTKAIGDSLMPVVTDLIKAFNAMMPEAIIIVRGALSGLTAAFLYTKNGVVVLWETINAMVNTVAAPILALGSAIYKSLHGDFTGAAADIKGIGSTIADAWGGAMDRMTESSANTAQQVKDLFSADTAVGNNGSEVGDKNAPDVHKGSKGGGKAPKAEKSQMGEFQARLEAEKVAYTEIDALHGLSKQAELDYWTGILNTANLSEADRLAVTKQVSAARIVVLHKEATEAKQLQGISLHDWEAGELSKVAMAEEAAKNRVAAGDEEKLQLLQQEVNFEDQRNAIKLTALRASQAVLDPDRDPIQYAQISSKIEALEQAHQLKLAQLRGKIAQQSAKEQGAIWATMNTEVSKLWDNGLKAMMNGTLTWRNAMRAVATDVAGILGNVIKKKVMAWIAGEQAQTGATVLGTAERGAAEAAASAQSLALWAATAVKNIMSSAWEAMAGAWKAIVGIPYVGPVLAPIAAAAAFAGVAAIASNVSAAGGYDIPAGVNPVTQLHQREMVLPAKHADVIRSMADGGGGGGGAIHLNVSAVDAQSVKRLFNDHAPALADALRKQIGRFG